MNKNNPTENGGIKNWEVQIYWLTPLTLVHNWSQSCLHSEIQTSKGHTVWLSLKNLTEGHIPVSSSNI